MADEDNEFERPRKIPKTLKEKDSGKRLIVILEKASLETVKVIQSLVYLQSLFKHETFVILKRIRLVTKMHMYTYLSHSPKRYTRKLLKKEN